MRRFIKKISLFTVIIATAFICWFAYLSHGIRLHDDYICEFPHKVELVRETCGEPRIVMIGGSNMAFGIDSKRISDTLGIRVVNSSLHAGMGLKAPMDILSPYIKEGDIVVLMPEYNFFFGDAYYGGNTLTTFILYYPESLLRLNLKSVLIGLNGVRAVKPMPSNVGEMTKEDEADYFKYTSHGFNEYGDEISHLKYEPPKKIENYKLTDEINHQTIKDYLSTLQEWESRGVRIFIFYPCLNEKSYEMNRQKIDTLLTYLQNTDYPFYGELENSIFYEDEMFDTEYHLNNKGVDRNTSRIISELCKANPSSVNP